jgi:hypothetical protein
VVSISGRFGAPRPRATDNQHRVQRVLLCRRRGASCVDAPTRLGRTSTGRLEARSGAPADSCLPRTEQQRSRHHRPPGRLGNKLSIQPPPTAASDASDNALSGHALDREPPSGRAPRRSPWRIVGDVVRVVSKKNARRGQLGARHRCVGRRCGDAGMHEAGSTREGASGRELIASRPSGCEGFTLSGHCPRGPAVWVPHQFRVRWDGRGPRNVAAMSKTKNRLSNAECAQRRLRDVVVT